MFSFGARILVIAWYFVVLVLTQSYTASLASLLTSQQLHPTITSMSSLLERGERVGYQRTSFIFGKLKEAGFSPSTLVAFDTSEECDELLRNGPEKGGISAAFLETPYLRLLLGQYCNTYKMVEEPFNIDGFGFVSFQSFFFFWNTRKFGIETRYPSLGLFWESFSEIISPFCRFFQSDLL